MRQVEEQQHVQRQLQMMQQQQHHQQQLQQEQHFMYNRMGNAPMGPTMGQPPLPPMPPPDMAPLPSANGNGKILFGFFGQMIMRLRIEEMILRFFGFFGNSP